MINKEMRRATSPVKLDRKHKDCPEGQGDVDVLDDCQARSQVLSHHKHSAIAIPMTAKIAPKTTQRNTIVESSISMGRRLQPALFIASPCSVHFNNGFQHAVNMLDWEESEPLPPASIQDTHQSTQSAVVREVIAPVLRGLPKSRKTPGF